MFLSKYCRMWLTISLLAAIFLFFLCKYNFLVAEGASVDVMRAEQQTLPVAEYQTDRDYGAVVLMYHHIVTDEEFAKGTHTGNNAVISLSQFEEEMAYLAENGYHTFLMSEVAAILHNDLGFPPKSVVITFDDGYASNYHLAYPVLLDYNLKATISVMVLSSVEASSKKGGAVQYLPHLTFDQIREMLDSGLIEIGSHSYDGHGLVQKNASGKQDKFFDSRKYLPQEGRIETEAEYIERITQDLRKAKAVLEGTLQTNIRFFAYPYGVSNKTLREILAKEGYLTAVTTAKGNIDVDSKPLQLNRCNVDQGISLSEFVKLVTVD